MSKQKYLNKEESKKIFEEGFVECDYWEMVAYSRYAFHIKEWSRDKILKNIKEKLLEKGKNTILLRSTIYEAIKGYKYDFLERNQIEVTNPEIEQIKKINIRDYQRAMFGILVLAKQKGGQHGDKLFFSGDIKELILKSGTAFTPKEFKDFLYFSKKYGFISSYIKKKNKSISIVWVITFAKDGDIYCTIDRFDKVQNYLPTWCIVCKEEISRGKYCRKHKRRRVK